MDIIREILLLRAENLLLRIASICEQSEKIEGDGVSLDEQKSHVFWGLYNDQYHLLDDIKKFLNAMEVLDKSSKHDVDNDPNLCPYINCYAGMGVAGMRRCFAGGDWRNPNCLKFMSCEEYEAKEGKLNV